MSTTIKPARLLPGWQFWVHHIQNHQKSQFGQARYCREHKLKLSIFRYWERKLNPDKRLIAATGKEVVSPGRDTGLSLFPCENYNNSFGLITKSNCVSTDNLCKAGLTTIPSYLSRVRDRSGEAPWGYQCAAPERSVAADSPAPPVWIRELWLSVCLYG